MNTRTPEGHRFKGAFRLMWYVDEVTGTRERIWNSRDGVTAFITSSRAGNKARHVDRHLDVYAPLHQPAIGDRVWIDLTYERALEHRRQFAEIWWNHPSYPMRKSYRSKEEAAERLATADVYLSPGEPNGAPELVEVDDALLEELTRARAERLSQLVRVELADGDGQVIALPGTRLAVIRSGGRADIDRLRGELTSPSAISSWGSPRQNLEALAQELPVFLDDTKRREGLAALLEVPRVDPDAFKSQRCQLPAPARPDPAGDAEEQAARKARRKRQRQARRRQARLRRRKTGRR